jgi:hypothetical protein
MAVTQRIEDMLSFHFGKRHAALRGFHDRTNQFD